MEPRIKRFIGVGVCRKRIIQRAPVGIAETTIIKQPTERRQDAEGRRQERTCDECCEEIYPKMLYLKRK
jgi:hypothetical protein